MTGIVTLTLNPCIDQIASVDRVQREKKLRMSEPRFDPGGGGINVARAIRRLGGEVLAVYAAGGPHGTMLDDRLEHEALDHQRIDIDGLTRLNPNIFEEDDGAAFRFVMPGPTLDEGTVARCIDAAMEASPQYVIASGSVPGDTADDAYAKLARKASERGIRVIVDASGPALKRAIDQGVYLIKPNLRELGELEGEDLSGEEQIESAARRLVDGKRVCCVLASMGKGGALLVTAQQAVRLHTPTVQVRSRIGAGDSTVAGLVLALSRGMDISEAARFGVAAGADAVTRSGTELCEQETTEALYKQMSRAAKHENGSQS